MERQNPQLDREGVAKGLGLPRGDASGDREIT
jgi:hypothetical protein